MTKIGLDNASNTNTTGIPVNETVQQIADVTGNAALGSAELIGVFLLAIIAVALWKMEASMDTSVAVGVPTVFIVAWQGWLPGSRAILYLLILVVAFLFAMGVAKYWQR